MSALTKFQEIVTACHNAEDPHFVAACGEDNLYTGKDGYGSQALCADCVAKVEAMLKAEVTQPRMFPIQDGPAIPWAVIALHDRQACLNHGQSLERLAERGGLAPCEAVAVLEDRRWKRMDDDEALARLKNLAGWLSPDQAARRTLSAAEVELLRERVHADECDGDPCRCCGAEAEAILVRVSPEKS